ncbi:cytochrome P450 [Xylariaceae sp. FL0255]|nr:cytochrome P450 [Xylariaceae sp. FL0255]
MSLLIGGLWMAIFSIWLLAHHDTFRKYLNSGALKHLRYYHRRWQGLSYLLAGPQIIEEAYGKANGDTFVVPTPSNDYVMVTSTELIKEVIEAPVQSLSLHAMAKEMLQPKYTMHGFEWREQRGAEGTGFVRALRSRMTSHLALFQPSIEKIIQTTIEEEVGILGKDELAQVKLFPMIKRLVTKANSFVFFGEKLSQDEIFTDAALQFPQVVVFTAEILRITPEFLRPLVASWATSGHRAAKTLFRYLEPVVSERMAMQASQAKGTIPKKGPVDCIQWLIETSPQKDPWTTQRMIGEIMAVWFSTVHQLSIAAAFVVLDLCLHDEYVEPLRQEAHEYLVSNPGPLVTTGSENLPLLDSFIRESIRFSSADAISCRRKALRTYVLQDGSKVEKGDWVCVPQAAMLHDARRFSCPDQFQGFRFAEVTKSLQSHEALTPASLTTASIDWPIWGLGNAACPGRFYSALVLKLLTLQILSRWDCGLADKSIPRSLVWRSSIVPRSDTLVAFRKRSRSYS